MVEWMRQILLLELLVCNGISDVRRREISLPSLAVFGGIGILLNLLGQFQSVESLLAGVGVGALLLAAALLTGGAIGMGDGLLLCVAGLYLGGADNLQLLLTGTMLSGLILGTAALLGRIGWKDRFPLVPFLLAAEIGILLGRRWMG